MLAGMAMNVEAARQLTCAAAKSELAMVGTTVQDLTFISWR